MWNNDVPMPSPATLWLEDTDQPTSRINHRRDSMVDGPVSLPSLYDNQDLKERLHLPQYSDLTSRSFLPYGNRNRV